VSLLKQYFQIFKRNLCKLKLIMNEINAQLSEQFKQKALNELREDDSRKQQALEQFREWISRQGHIKYCRTGN